MMLHGPCGPVTYPVRLKVYDLSRGIAQRTTGIVLGKTIDAIYHTGICVYGREYWYGPSGIMCAPEEFFQSVNNLDPLDVHQTTTRMHQQQFEQFLRENECRFIRGTYNLAKNNCNNFANACSSFLTNGQRIPAYILAQPKDIASAPHATRLLPLIDMISKNMSCGFDADRMMKELDLGKPRAGRLGMSKVGQQAFREMVEAIQYSLSGQSQMMLVLNPFGEDHVVSLVLPENTYPATYFTPKEQSYVPFPPAPPIQQQSWNQPTMGGPTMGAPTMNAPTIKPVDV